MCRVNMHGTFFIMPENNNPWFWLESDWNLEYDWGLSHGMDILHPNRMQFAEWSQQMLATKYQNWWNSEQERMRRMQEAGINPYAAAQGIAGAGGSQGSVAGAPPAAGTGALPQMIDAASNALGATGNAFGQVAQGVSMLSKLRGELQKIDSETQLNLVNLGFSTLQSRALSIQLKYMDFKERMSCYLALANFDNTRAQYDILKQEHLNKIAELDQIIAETNLTTSLDEKAKADKDKIAEEARWQKDENDFWEQHGYLRGSPIYESLRDAAVNGKDVDIDALGDIVAGYEGKIYSAREIAAAEASWRSRPQNAAQMIASIGYLLGEGLSNILKTNDAKTAFNKINQNVDVSAEFDEFFDDVKDKLKENYRSAKRLYNKYKNCGNTQYVAELERRMNNAEDEYKSFSREKFTGQLVDFYSNQLEEVRK